jgi:hypothetical protein
LVFFSIIFFIVALYPLIKDEDVQVWAAVISLTFLLTALFTPKILKTPNQLWLQLGFLLGSIFAPIVMTIIYFVTIVPIGLIMRHHGKDTLKQEINKKSESYWIKRNVPSGIK